MRKNLSFAALRKQQACPYSRQPSGGEGGSGGGGDMQGEFLLKFGRYVLQLAVGPHDVADRLNYQHSVLLLLLVAGIVALKLFVFKPIQPWEEYTENYCWIASTYFVPASNQLKVAHPHVAPVSLPSENPAERTSRYLYYYQWVPIVLVLQCVLFLVPAHVGKLLSARMHVDIDSLLLCALDAHTAVGDQRERAIAYIARCIEDVLYRQRNRLAYLKYQKERIREYNESMLVSGMASSKSCEADHRCCLRALLTRLVSCCGAAFCARAVRSCCCCSGAAAAEDSSGGIDGCGPFRMCASGGGWWTCVPPGLSRSSGRYLSFVYLVTKTLYAANLVLQLYFMGRFLTTGGHSFASSSSTTTTTFGNGSVAAAALSLLGNHSYFLYGALVLRDLYNGIEWHESSLFPRITWCDFQIGGVGQPITHTVQCVLPINYLAEKFFILLWFWLVFVLLCTLLSLLLWSFRLLPQSRRRYIIRMLRLNDAIDLGDVKLARRFSDSLCADGALLLHMVMDRCGELLAGDVLLALWSNFLEDERSLAALLCRARLPSSSSGDAVGSTPAAVVATFPKLHHIGNKSGGAVRRGGSGGTPRVSPTSTATAAAAAARGRRVSTRFLRFNTGSALAVAAARKMSNGSLVCRMAPSLVARPSLGAGAATDLQEVVDEEAASDVSIGMPAPPADLEDIDERDVDTGLLLVDSLYSNKFL